MIPRPLFQTWTAVATSSVAIAVFFICTLNALSSTTPSSIQQSKNHDPIEVIDGSTFDFGRMEPGQHYEHRFVLRNRSQARAKLSVIRTTCKCTAAEIEQPDLFPGQETTVTVKWKADGQAKQFEQSVTIGSSFADQSEIKLAVRGVLGSDLEAIPQQVHLDSTANQPPKTQQFRVVSYHESQLALEKIRWTDAETAQSVRFEHHIRRLTDSEKLEFPDGRWIGEIKIIVESPLPTTKWSSQIEITTNANRMKPLAIPVSNEPKAEFEFISGANFDSTHNILRIGTLDSKVGKVAHLMLAVRVHDGKPAEIESLDQNEKQVIQTKIGPPKVRGNRAIYSIQLTIPPGAAPQRIDAQSDATSYKIRFQSISNPDDFITLGLIYEIR